MAYIYVLETSWRGKAATKKKEHEWHEYERKLVLYKVTDERFKKKYGMNFTDFEKGKRSN